MEQRLNIFDERKRIHDVGRGLFDDLLGETNRLEFARDLQNNYRKPFSSIKEKENDFVIYVELPGIEKNDVKLKVDGRNIEIRASKNKEERFEDQSERRYFRRFRGFYQSIELPKEAETKIIEKTHRNGLLKLRIPKKRLAKQMITKNN